MRYHRQNVVESIRASAAQRSMRVQRLRLEARTMLADHRAARLAMTPAGGRTEERRRQDAAPAPVPPSPLPSAGSVWDLCAEIEEEPDFLSEPLAIAVLDVIGKHPEGIGARGVGTLLGVDWRRVVAVGERLIGAGLVDQIGQAFYSAAPVNRTC
jgi:hypothetical protein